MNGKDLFNKFLDRCQRTHRVGSSLENDETELRRCRWERRNLVPGRPEAPYSYAHYGTVQDAAQGVMIPLPRRPSWQVMSNVGGAAS